jgi:hypothetical protein
MNQWFNSELKLQKTPKIQSTHDVIENETREIIGRYQQHVFQWQKSKSGTQAT